VCALGLLLACSSNEPDAQSAGQEIGVLLPREPQQLDPRHVGDAYGLKLSRLLHASLFTIDPESLDVVFDLAADYRVDEGVRYRVRLKSGLRFSDGSPLTAHDVVATFRALVDPAVGSRFARSYARIQQVRALSDLQVEFVLDAPHATFLTDLEMPVLRADQAASAAGGPEGGLVGAGPYRMLSREAGVWRV